VHVSKTFKSLKKLHRTSGHDSRFTIHKSRSFTASLVSSGN
jgi:hypothetical protein